MIYMSKTNLTAKQVKELSKNPYIKLVNDHYISYTEDFLKKLVYEMEENNKTSRQVFNECGIDTNIIGEHRAACVAYKWRKRYSKTGDIKDTRPGNSGAALKRELSDKEKLERAEAKIKLLEAENELLKKNEMTELGLLKDIKSISNLK